ncbi:MAG: sugar phosphate isomerase/epimerase [Actinobacteria bacterium]|nr:sugar phosphate isomerase/epimerase [Actinomycetota bacterium]
MHPQLSVSAVSSWQWTLDEDLAFWERAGISHVGLSFRKLEEAGADASVARVRDAGLRVSNIVELGWWKLGDRATWSRQQDRLLVAVDAARNFGACLVLTTGPAGSLDWDAAADALGEALEPVAAAAAAEGVVLTIEHTGALRLDLSFCTTARDGLDLARRLDTGLCLELNSCFAERDLHATIRAAAADHVLTHVQVSDFVIGSLSTPDRAVPGDGDIPLDRIVGQIFSSGYTGAFELEMVGPRIEEEGYESAIQRGIAHLDSLFAQASA